MLRRRALLSILALNACATPPIDPGEVKIAPGLRLRIPPPASLGRRLEVTQLVQAKYGVQNLVFEARISATPERFLLVCLDPLGRKAMTISWTAAGISTEKAAFVPDGLAPENMLADIILLYWPAAVVRQAFIQTDATLEATHASRVISQGGTEIIRATYTTPPGADPWNGQVSYRHGPWGYSLDIQSRIIGP